MATFNYTVDTNPMADKIGSVSNKVKETTTAVVAMQTAVVLAEGHAANHVCGNVNKGFYTLIRSQISQKIARLKSDVDSHLMRLVQQRKQLEAIQKRMERDYNMIAARYKKLFDGLNANLEQRIFELDKPAVDFAVKEIDKVSNRTTSLTATVPVAQLESLAVSQQIIASNVKNRGSKVIGSMSHFLSDMYEQKELTNRILLSTYSNVQNKRISVPVLICECNFDKFDQKTTDIMLNRSQWNQAVQSLVKNTVAEAGDRLQWKSKQDINREIKSEFSRLIASSNVSTRVKETANNLFMSNHFQTL